jgi:hypothetical protein
VEQSHDDRDRRDDRARPTGKPVGCAFFFLDEGFGFFQLLFGDDAVVGRPTFGGELWRVGPGMLSPTWTAVLFLFLSPVVRRDTNARFLKRQNDCNGF